MRQGQINFNLHTWIENMPVVQLWILLNTGKEFCNFIYLFIVSNYTDKFYTYIY